MDDAQRRPRPVIVTPVLKPRDIVLAQSVPRIPHGRVDGFEAAVERHVLHRAARHPLSERVGPPRADPRQRRRRRKGSGRVACCGQLGVERQSFPFRRDCSRPIAVVSTDGIIDAATMDATAVRRPISANADASTISLSRNDNSLRSGRPLGPASAPGTSGTGMDGVASVVTVVSLSVKRMVARSRTIGRHCRRARPAASRRRCRELR